MNEKQIKAAKVGDRVKFVPLEHDAGEYSEGTITIKLNQTIEVTWDDGEVNSMRADPASRVVPL
jgi:hypothetical protein